MQTLIEKIIANYPSAAQCAAALGISRQALHQAITRHRLSERATIRAAALLNIDPGQALLANATPEKITPPASETTPQPPSEPLNITPEKRPDNTNYAQSRNPKKSGIMPAVQNVHFIPQSNKRQFEIDCVKWMLAIPKISPDSPRFLHYFSRYVVPEKIAASKKRGDFQELTKEHNHFNPDLCLYIEAGMKEYRLFAKQPEPDKEPTQQKTSDPMNSLNEKQITDSQTKFKDKKKRPA